MPVSGRSKTWWWVAAVVAVIACCWLYWDIAQSASAPRTPWDENHLLQMARVIAGEQDVTPMSGSGYYPGWAVLIAPIWWLTDDAATVYSIAVWVSNVLAFATIAPLALIARHYGLNAPQAITVAAVVMLFPGRAVLADYALSEQPLMLLYALTVLAMHKLWQRPTWWGVLLLVLATGATYFTHSRALALVATVAVWLILLCFRSWRLGVLGLVTLGLSALGIKRLAEAISNQVLVSGFGKVDVLQSGLEESTPGLFARVLLNQSWAQAVGTLGLVFIGTVVVIVWAAREWKVLRPGPGTFYFGLGLSALLMSGVWWTRADVLWSDLEIPRLDAWLYSRYIDNISVFISLIALAVLIRGISRNMLLTAGALFTAVALPVVLWVARDVPLWGSTDGPANASAILAWAEAFPEVDFGLPQTPTLTNENSFWIWASLTVVGCLLVCLLLRRQPFILVVLFGVAGTITSLNADPDQPRYAPYNLEETVELIEDVTGQEDVDIDFDYGCSGPGLTRYEALNWSGYWLSPRSVDFVDRPDGEDFDSEVVISCSDWPEAEEFGAERVEGETSYTYGVWVLPGEIQDELARSGDLVEPLPTGEPAT